jgi:hypothetical protein
MMFNNEKKINPEGYPDEMYPSLLNKLLGYIQEIEDGQFFV